MKHWIYLDTSAIINKDLLNSGSQKNWWFLLVSTTDKINYESKIWMKYGANLLEK